MGAGGRVQSEVRTGREVQHVPDQSPRKQTEGHPESWGVQSLRFRGPRARQLDSRRPPSQLQKPEDGLQRGRS